MITLLGSIQFISWPPNHSRSPPAPQPRFFVTPLALSKGNLHFFSQMCGIIDSLSFMKCWFTKGDPAHLCHVEINQVQHLGRLKMKRLLRNIPFTKRTQELLSPFSPIQFVLSGQSSQPLRKKEKLPQAKRSPWVGGKFNISSKFSHQVAPHAFVGNSSQQKAPLASVRNLATR